MMPPELRPGCPQPGLRSGLLGQRRGGRCGARVQHRHWLGGVLSFPRVCPEGGGILVGAVASWRGRDPAKPQPSQKGGQGPPTVVCWNLLVACPQGKPEGQETAGGGGGRGAWRADGDFSAQLTFVQKESGHPGRREKPGQVPQFSQIIVTVPVGTWALPAAGRRHQEAAQVSRGLGLCRRS